MLGAAPYLQTQRDRFTSICWSQPFCRTSADSWRQHQAANGGRELVVGRTPDLLVVTLVKHPRFFFSVKLMACRCRWTSLDSLFIDLRISGLIHLQTFIGASCPSFLLTITRDKHGRYIRYWFFPAKNTWEIRPGENVALITGRHCSL